MPLPHLPVNHDVFRHVAALFFNENLRNLLIEMDYNASKSETKIKHWKIYQISRSEIIWTPRITRPWNRNSIFALVEEAESPASSFGARSTECRRRRDKQAAGDCSIIAARTLRNYLRSIILYLAQRGPLTAWAYLWIRRAAYTYLRVTRIPPNVYAYHTAMHNVYEVSTAAGKYDNCRKMRQKNSKRNSRR